MDTAKVVDVQTGSSSSELITALTFTAANISPAPEQDKDSTNIYRSILIGLGVLVIAVFGVGFVVGYCVRDKCQRKRENKESDALSEVSVKSMTEDRYKPDEDRYTSHLNNYENNKRPPALPPCPHPTLSKYDQIEQTLREEKPQDGSPKKAESGFDDGTKQTCGSENDIDITAQSGSGNDVATRWDNDNCRTSELTNYIDSREIHPRNARIEESTSVIIVKNKGREPTYLSLLGRSTTISDISESRGDEVV